MPFYDGGVNSTKHLSLQEPGLSNKASLQINLLAEVLAC